LALERKIRAVCHYKLLSEYREVLFRMVKGGELRYSWAQVERFLAALGNNVRRAGSAVSVETEPPG
jgi:hypothetical protein